MYLRNLVASPEMSGRVDHGAWIVNGNQVFWAGFWDNGTFKIIIFSLKRVFTIPS